MKHYQQKFALAVLPLIYLIIFYGLKSGFQQNLLALQNSAYPMAVLAFTILSDALVTIFVLIFNSHIWANVFAGCTFVISVVLYNIFHSKLGLFCAPSELIISMFWAYIAAYLVKYLLSRSNKRLLNTIIGAYLSKKTRNNIISGISACEPISKDVTILECNIFNIERLVLNNSPKDLYAKINFVLNTVIDRIMKNGGRVDKFIGTTIVAYWENPDDCYLAVKAAMEACEYLDITKGANDIKLGIGIHFDNALFGLLGTSKVMNYSMISPAMETLEQIVSNAYLYDKRILISKSVYKQGWRYISGIKVATLNLRGVGNTTELYEPIEVKQKFKLTDFGAKNND